MTDPWILLAALATLTQRIRLGVLVTPIARRRPWKLAREAITLDHLSEGRLILGVGIGGDWIGEYSTFGESTDDQLHGEQLGEGLAVLDRLWSGEQFSFSGAHYHISETQFLPQPVQQPRIPIWVGAGWPRSRPIERATRWDGIVPFKHGGSLTPDDYRAMIATIQAHRHDDAPFDTVCYATTVAADGVVEGAVIAEFADAQTLRNIVARLGMRALEPEAR